MSALALLAPRAAQWISRSTAWRSSQCQEGSSSTCVDAPPVAVVRAQDGLVALGAVGVLERLGAAGELAGVPQAVHSPAAPLALQRLA